MFSDLKLICGSEKVELPCHRVVLCARSPVFLAMFQRDTAEAQMKEIEMPDVEPKVAERILKYIYSGHIKTIEPGMEEELLAAADRYKLLELKEHCELALCERMLKDTDVESALEMLFIADQHSASMLKDICVEFLVENCQRLVRIPGWIEKIQAYPYLLAELFVWPREDS